jgi:acetyl esterase/lipase
MLVRQELDLADPAEAKAINEQLISMPHQDVRTTAGLAELRAISHAPPGGADLAGAGLAGAGLAGAGLAGAGLEIDTDGTRLRLRTFAGHGPARAVLVHIHGGGFCIGEPEEDDRWNAMLERECQVAVISPEYRLAPEYPHPSGVRDCIAAASWAARDSAQVFGSERLVIAGGSAGGHLAAGTLLALRDQGLIGRVAAASILFGVLDASMTPSQLSATDDTLVLTRGWLDAFYDLEFPGTSLVGRRDPRLSPLYADLRELPPALFTVGTLDPLLDDSLFMAERWHAAGNDAYLDVYPGAVHGFCNIYPASGAVAWRRMARWISARLDDADRDGEARDGAARM